MFWRSRILRSLALLPLLAASSASQVKYTGPNRGVLAFGPLFTQVEEQSALGMEVGYAEDFRMGLSAFIAASGHAASLTIVGLSVEAGVLRPEESFRLGIIGGLSMAQAFSGGASSSSGGITAQLYTETGDTTSLIWYPSVIGSLRSFSFCDAIFPLAGFKQVRNPCIFMKARSYTFLIIACTLLTACSTTIPVRVDKPGPTDRWKT